jgi:hypothetical protein
VTLRIYAKVMQWREGERERLRALVEGAEWEQIGTMGGSERTNGAASRTPAIEETAP